MTDTRADHNQPGDYLEAAEVLALVPGLTPRRLYTWAAAGHLGEHRRNPGSGKHNRYGDADVIRLRAMTALTWSGVRPAVAARARVNAAGTEAAVRLATNVFATVDLRTPTPCGIVSTMTTTQTFAVTITLDDVTGTDADEVADFIEDTLAPLGVRFEVIGARRRGDAVALAGFASVDPAPGASMILGIRVCDAIADTGTVARVAVTEI